jgi:hypothetical protein
VTESSRIWHREELHNMYSINNYWDNKVDNWRGRTCSLDGTVVTKFCREGSDFLENLGINGRIVCKWILRIESGRVQIGFYCLSVGSSV